MMLIIGVVSGLIIVNKLIGIHIKSDFIDQEIEQELRIVR